MQLLKEKVCQAFGLTLQRLSSQLQPRSLIAHGMANTTKVVHEQ